MASPSRLPSVRRKPASSSRPASMIHDGKPTLRPTQGHLDTDRATSKRHNLLPQFSRSHHSDADGLDGIAHEEGDHQGAGTTGAAREDALAALESRDTMLSPAEKVSRLARPTSMRPPGTTSRTSRPQSMYMGGEESGHTSRSSISARPEATTASRASVTSTGLQRTTSTRTSQGPKPLGRSASVQQKQPTHSRNASVTSTATTTTADKRASIQRPRPSSIDTSNQASRPSSGVSSPRSPKPATTTARPASSSTNTVKPALRTQMLPPSSSSRPSFTTYQQYYSPSKTSGLPKPPLPSSKPSSTAKTPISSSQQPEPQTFETTLLQAELLQLSLLHQASAQTQRDWEDSAKRKLGKWHARLRREVESLRAAEADVARRRNLEALNAWCGGEEGVLVESLGTLGRVWEVVTGLTGSGGRYAVLVGGFEAWVKDAENRFCDGYEGGGFVEALPEGWKEAHASLGLKLRTLVRELGTLPPLPGEVEGSSLGVVVGSCEALVKGMVREVDVMVAVEREVLDREKGRVDDAVKLCVSQGLEVKKRDWVPAWRKAG